jgi:ABC-2 type transport system permease protein
MSAFKQFIKKEFYHIFRDTRTLVVLIGMPIIQVILFGYAIRTEINDADIGILDKSRDYATTELTNKLLSSGYFNLAVYFDNESQFEKAFREGKVKQIIVFDEDFAVNLEKESKAKFQLINDASNPNMATQLNAYVYSIINDYISELNQKEGKTIAVIVPELRMLYNPELKSVYLFVPGLISFILLLVSTLMTSIAITKERELGTMEVLLVSPLKPTTIILGKVAPYILIALLNAASVIILSLIVFKLPFNGDPLLYFFEILLFIITALALGIFISTIAKTQQVAMMVSLAGLMMPSILLSGFIFPVENMPLVLQIVSNIIPSTWFLIIVKGIILKGIGIEYLWKETLILAGMCVFFIILSIRKFKTRLE